MQKKKNLPFLQLSEEQKKCLLEEIEAFFLDSRDESIGLIQQQQLLDFFLERLSPVVYNKALDDARKWYLQMQDNLESDFYLLYKDIR